jgi:glycosyltransferase involved in cell wall biosynthesis
MSTTAVPDLVSVVVPCHNAEPFVAETLQSVLAQSHPAVEAIVVDDASTDGSWEIVQGFAARHPDRVRALRLERNRGGGHARNRGAEMARGAYLMFLDADDLITPDALAAIVAAVRDAPGTLGAGESRMLRQRNDRGPWEPGESSAPLPDADPAVALRQWLFGSAWVPTCALLWRRDAYEATGGWDEELARNQDGDIAMRALAGGARIVCIPRTVGYYRMHGTTRISVSRNFVAPGKLQSQLRVLDRLSALLESQGRLPPYRRALGAAYHDVALMGFQNGHDDLARNALAQGRQLGGRSFVSATGPGRALERVLGLERKERVAQALARAGFLTRGRRTLAGLHARAAGGGS